MSISTESESIESRVRQVVARYGRVAGGGASLSNDASLAAAGMTSLAAVDVMLALESEFGEFPERMLTGSVFHSIGSITAALKELQNG